MKPEAANHPTNDLDRVNSIRKFGLNLLMPFLLLSLSACTSLNVHKLTGESKDSEREGISYFLPVKQLRVDLAFTLTRCETKAAKPVLSYVASAKVQEVQLPDLSERYVISYRDLSAMTKTTDLTIATSEQGLLVSVNAKVTDQTGPVLASIASAGFSFARGAGLKAATLPLATSGLKEEKTDSPPPPCDKFLIKLKAFESATEALKKAIEADQRRDKVATDRTKAAVGYKLAQAKLSEATKAKDPAAIEDAKKDLAEKKAKFDEAQDEFQKLAAPATRLATENLDEARAAITLTRSAFWTPFIDEKSTILQVSELAVVDMGFDTEHAKKLSSQIAANLELLPVGKDVSLKDAAHHPKAGIVYRQPAHLMLKITSITTDSDSKPKQVSEAKGLVPADDNIYAAVHAFPQFGAKASLPLSNGLFEDNGLIVTFGESGQPKTVTFNSKSSAERGALAAKDLGTDYLAFIKGRQSDQLDLRKSLREDAEGELSLQTKRRDAQLDTLDDRIETLKKYQALESARAGNASRSQVLEDTLTARKRQLALEIEIKEQENKLKSLGVPSN